MKRRACAQIEPGRWRVQGHQQGWLFRQAARGRRSGEARRAGTPLEHDRAPWDALGVSRRTWYRHFRGAKTDGENRWAKPIGEGWH